jgi:hypothetical protein
MARFGVLEHLAGRPLVRRLTDAVLGSWARRRVAALDRRPATAVQERTLLRLVRRARGTRFGRDHDFARVRSVADYQARVPLRDYEAFWSAYWRGPFPVLDGVTWPGLVPYFALSSGTSGGPTKYVPVSRAVLASNRRAALTTLALFLATHPRTPLFTGRLFFLGGSTDLRTLTRTPAAVRAGDLSGIVAREVSPLLRPYTFPPLDLALLADWDEKLDRLVERAVGLPITMLSGVPSWLLALFDRLRRRTGKERIAEVWPGLRLVLHGGTRFDPYRTLFREIVGSQAVHFQETYPASEGFVAAEDPRHDLLRLLPDTGVFFEFVPRGELDKPAPTRHTVRDLETGVVYAVVLTTGAGLWSYVLGDTVVFERREPLLLRFTGRTRDFLSAFGEHLTGDEIERAVAAAAAAVGAAVVDYHAGPVFPGDPGVAGRHRYFVEFAGPGCGALAGAFGRALDAALCRLNEDYAAHRAGDLTLGPPEVWPVPPGGFAAWMRGRGQLGGQHKVPRVDNTGRLTATLAGFFAALRVASSQ